MFLAKQTLWKEHVLMYIGCVNFHREISYFQSVSCHKCVMNACSKAICLPDPTEYFQPVLYRSCFPFYKLFFSNWKIDTTSLIVNV